MNERFSSTPEPPYYAVIFTGQLKQQHDGYEKMGEKMFELAMEQPGCLGSESTRDDQGLGITVSYWKDEQSIAQWKKHLSHIAAQRLGIERWYDHYEIRVAKVERAYSGPQNRTLS